MKKKIKALLYCTKAKPYLNCDYGLYDSESYFPEHFIYLANKKDECSEVANGKIVAECDFEVEEIKKVNYDFMLFTNTLGIEKLINKSCVGYFELFEYLKPNWDKEDDLQNLDTVGYAIHIKNLNIFDSPKFLEGFDDNEGHTLRKAPQNMCKVLRVKIGDYDYKDLNSKSYEPYILISIKPEWLCKILNGEKTIEVRKKVLKEMLKNE